MLFTSGKPVSICTALNLKVSNPFYRVSDLFLCCHVHSGIKGLCESISCRTVALKTRHELSVGQCNNASHALFFFFFPICKCLSLQQQIGVKESHKVNPREKVGMLRLVDCILVTGHYQVSDGTLWSKVHFYFTW